jgi:hypothetical protein
MASPSVSLSSRFIDGCQAHLTLLDERCADNRRLDALEPFQLAVGDSAEINQAARRIADFVGLTDCSFFVRFSSEVDEEEVAGYIELSRCRIVLAKSIRGNSKAVLATLAHEISHKYLDVHGVPSPSGRHRGSEDEVFTEVTSVWLGLGKLVLNGCESSTTKTGWTGLSMSETVHRLGYVTRLQFACAYALVCERNGLDRADWERELDPGALADVREAQYQLLQMRSGGAQVDVHGDLAVSVVPTRSRAGKISEKVFNTILFLLFFAGVLWLLGGALFFTSGPSAR